MKLQWMDSMQLNRQINLIESHIPNNNTCILGNSVQEKVLNIYKNAKTETAYTEDRLIVTYDSYKTVTVPMRKDKKLL